MIDSTRPWFPLFFAHLPRVIEAEIDAGLLDAARARLHEALPLLRAGRWGFYLAEALLAKGRLDSDEDALHEALAIAVSVGARGHTVLALERIAALAVAQESYDEGARLLAAAAAERDRLGLVGFPTDGHAAEDATASARDRLGDDAFAEAWADGAALSIEDAAAYATRGRGERKRPSTGWASLTPTELEVIRHVVRGLSNPQIAEKLFVARNTVRAHLSHIFQKLGMSSRTELATEATRRGL